MLMHRHKNCSFTFWNILCLVYKNRTVQISRVLFSKLVPLINWMDYVFVGCLCYLHHCVFNLSTQFWEIVRMCCTCKHQGEKKNIHLLLLLCLIILCIYKGLKWNVIFNSPLTVDNITLSSFFPQPAWKLIPHFHLKSAIQSRSK